MKKSTVIVFCEFKNTNGSKEGIKDEETLFAESSLKAMYNSGHFPQNLPIPLSLDNLEATDGPRVGNWIQSLSPHLKDHYPLDYAFLSSDRSRMVESLHKKLERCSSDYSQVIVLISYATCHAELAVQLMRSIRHSFKTIKIAVGGIHVSSLPIEKLYRLPCDVAVVHEADSVIKKVVDDLVEMGDGANYNLCKVINGFANHTDRKWDWELYLKHTSGLNRFIPRISVKRWCSNRCYFCSKIKSKPLHDGIWQKAERWMNGFCEGVGTDRVHFKICDPEISVDEYENNGAIDFFSRQTFSWDCQMRLFVTDKKKRTGLQKMYISGCTSVFFGVESFQQKALNALGKRIDAGIISSCLKDTSDQGIAVLIPLIIGIPTQTCDDILKDIDTTVELIQKKVVSVCLPQILVIYPGTPFFNNPSRHGIELQNYDMSSVESRIMHSTNQLTTSKIKEMYLFALKTFTDVHNEVWS